MNFPLARCVLPQVLMVPDGGVRPSVDISGTPASERKISDQANTKEDTKKSFRMNAQNQ